MIAAPDDDLLEPLSDWEPRMLGDAGIAQFAGRFILDAQPPIDDETLDAVAERCRSYRSGDCGVSPWTGRRPMTTWHCSRVWWRWELTRRRKSAMG